MFLVENQRQRGEKEEKKMGLGSIRSAESFFLIILLVVRRLEFL